jgi:putative transposase
VQELVRSPRIAGETYHLYNRDVDRQEVFFERENYLFFLRRLRRHLVGQTSEVLETSIIAYCLMPDQFHLLVQPHHDQLSRQMQRLLISYTKAINERYGRVGPLFQGQFQAVHVESSRSLTHLSRYIHLNPVTAGLVARPEEWEYSSYREYLGVRSGSLPRPRLLPGRVRPAALRRARAPAPASKRGRGRAIPCARGRRGAQPAKGC